MSARSLGRPEARLFVMNSARPMSGIDMFDNSAVACPAQTVSQVTPLMADLPPVQILHASVELYPKGQDARRSADRQLDPDREGDRRAWLKTDATAQAGASLFRPNAEIPVAMLPSGAYTIRATLMAGDQPAGSVAAIVRKPWPGQVSFSSERMSLTSRFDSSHTPLGSIY